MIQGSFLHVPGIGPRSQEILRSKGFHTWNDSIENSSELPFSINKNRSIIETIENSVTAFENRDINYFVRSLPVKEHWRILATWFQEATFFDIETSGLTWYDSEPSVICAWHKGEVCTFIYEKNLTEFLNLLEDCTLLVTFNGSSFDVPFLEQFFHIPDIGCPHVDMRWIAYHKGYSGGLKDIEKRCGYTRPVEVGDIHGSEAVDLFFEWQRGNIRALELLCRYCLEDVLALKFVSECLLKNQLAHNLEEANVECLIGQEMQM